MAGLGQSVSNNLPPQLTSFVGREPELAEVKRLLLSTRLLTHPWTGPLPDALPVSDVPGLAVERGNGFALAAD